MAKALIDLLPTLIHHTVCNCTHAFQQKVVKLLKIWLRWPFMQQKLIETWLSMLEMSHK